MAGRRDAAAWVVVVGLSLLLAGSLAVPVVATTTPNCDAGPDSPACAQDEDPSRAAVQGITEDAADRALADRTPRTSEARERWDPPWLAWMSAIAVVLVALAAAWWLFLERRIQDRD